MRKVDDGATAHDHLASAARQLGKNMPAASRVDERPEPPRELAYLWAWFVEIVQGIGGNGFSPPIVSWTALADWSRLAGVELYPWEARALVHLGLVRASILAEKPKTPGKP